MTTVKVHGKKITFSDEELKSVMESYFAPTPQEGRWFRVDPMTIDQEIFDFERKDKNQEKTRQYILDAFVEVLNNPKYKHPFYTYIPAKEWKEKTYEGFETLAFEVGGHIATWVHQALEWAQRIANGESWKSICNEEDKTNWYRLVNGKNEELWLVGAAKLDDTHFPATDILMQRYSSKEKFGVAVPLVVKYK